MLGTYHLSILYDILKDLHFLHQSEKIYSYLLENTVKALDSEAASLFVADPKNENLRLRASIGPKKNMLELIAEELPFPYGKGICGWVAKYNQPIIIEDARADSRFNPQVDTLTGYRTKSILCAPLSNKDQVLGVIEILNKKSSAFNKNDMDLVTVIARQAAIALENGRLYTELEAHQNFNESILGNLSGGVIAIDDKWNVTHLNPSAEQILFLSAVQSIGKSVSEVLKNYPSVYKEIVDTLTAKEKKFHQQIACVRTDQSEIQIGYSTFLIQDRLRKLLGAGIIFQNLTQFTAK